MIASMKRFLLAVAGTLLLFAQDWRQNATRLFEQGDYRQAVAVLETRLREDRSDVSAHILLGLSHQQLGAYAAADVSFGAAIQLEPKNPRAHYARARVRFFLGRFEEALASAAEAERLGEPRARVYNLRARIEEERGRFIEAVEQYRRALVADSKMVQALSGQASALYKLGRYSEARVSAQTALRLEPNNTEAIRILERVAAAAAPQSRPPSSAQPVRFVRKDSIPFRLEHFPTAQKHLISTMAGGLAAFDFDNDGRLDLFFANGAEIPSLKKTGVRYWNRLYRNLGDWQFEDVTEIQGLQGEGFAMGAAAGDYDGDGREDLFVPGVQRNVLYRNTPSGFVEVSTRAGILNEAWSVAAAWLDYDGDGRLDLFVVNYLDWRPDDDRYCGDRSKALRVYCHPREFHGLANRLYRNRGDGTFEDVSARAGIAKHVGKGMSAAVVDADQDGWLDIFVTNDTQANFLFRNLGDGTFEEAALRLGVALNEQGSPISSMGVDARDYDNDGRPDLIVTALVGENFLLLRNQPNGGFQDVTFPSRLGLLAARRSGWGVALADFNNDGWKDLITANGHVTDNIERLRNERYKEPSTVFLNQHGAFVSAQELGPPAPHRGVVAADLDNDGRLDLAITVLGERPELWRNETVGGNWVRFKLEGNSIGARIQIGSQWQERSSASGYASSNLDALHFGLGSRVEVPEVSIVWRVATGRC
jgi:tetratricopeptide (TPR) repeat protein